jgi:hypothetical protein
MQRQESTGAGTPLASGRVLSGGLPLVRVRGRTVVIAILATLAAAAAAIVGSAERDAWLRWHPPVPNLAGMTVEQAARLMVPLHFGLIVNRSAQHPDAPMGMILVQNPSPGRRLAIGSIVQVTANQGSGVVPRLRGEPVAVAARELEAVGLRLGKVQGIEDSAPPDTVLEQFTPPGRRLNPNSSVDVLVSGVPNTGPAEPVPQPPPAASSPGLEAVPNVPVVPLPPAPRVAAPAVAPAPGSVLAPTQVQEEDNTGARATSGQCSTHPERERVEVCHEPEGDRGTQPDVHRSEHRRFPAGP